MRFRAVVFQNGVANGNALIADVSPGIIAGDEMSLATASCDLWQNEQRSVSSGVLGFTILLLGSVGPCIWPAAHLTSLL